VILHLAIACACGYFAHWTYLLTGRLSNGWSQLSAYTLGVLFAFPFVAIIHNDLADIKEPKKRLTAAYFLAYLAFGIGTAIGWNFHPIESPTVAMMDDRGIR
jgi:polyferredoxin